MKKLLHIIASPRGEQSRTLQVSETFLETFMEHHPGWLIDELNLAKEELPSMNAKMADGKYVLLSGKELFGALKEKWNEILQHIERFKMADLFLISTPMWNFSIPYTLKHYIDIIVQPRYLFHFTKSGSEGLVKGKKMIVITSRGGQYSGDLKSFDFQEPYLRTVFTFVGFEDIRFIKAEGMDRGADLSKQNLGQAKEEARRLAEEI